MKSDQAAAGFAVCIVFPILMSIAMGLRIWSYRIKGSGAHADDYILICASVRSVLDLVEAHA